MVEYLAAQVSCHAKLYTLGCIALLPARRNVRLAYRRQCIPGAMRSTPEQAQLSFAAALKSGGGRKQQLQEFWVGP